MKKKTAIPSPQSPALRFILSAYHVFGDRTLSRQRLGHIITSLVRKAITYKRKFDLGDFAYLDREVFCTGPSMHKDYDIADFYSAAVDCANYGHPSAAVSIEHWLKFKPFLIRQASRKWIRLRIGSEFTWQGVTVKVTSISPKQGHLIACQIQNHRGINDCHYIDGNYRCVNKRQQLKDATLIIHYGAMRAYQPDKVTRRFTLTHADLAARDNAAVALHAKLKKEILAVKTLAELEAFEKQWDHNTTEIRHTLRHWETEALRDVFSHHSSQIISQADPEELSAYRARKRDSETLRAAEAIAKWRAGGPWTAGYTKTNYLRINGETVDVSNGNFVTLDDARQALPVLIRMHRNLKSPLEIEESIRIGDFHLKRVAKDHVKIGCTEIPWTEVQWLNAEISKLDHPT